MFKFSCPATLEFNEILSVCTNPCKKCETLVGLPVPSIPIKGPDTIQTQTESPTVLISDVLYSPSQNFGVASTEPDSSYVAPLTTSADIWTDILAEPSTVAPTAPSALAISEAPTEPTPIQLAVSLETNEQSNSAIAPLDSLFTVNCTSNKFYRFPNDCTRFYQCHQQSVSIFSCAPGLIFDEILARCALPNESPCDQELNEGPLATGLAEFLEMDCSGAMHRYPFDCRHFYQCYNDGLSKSLLFYSCSVGLIFDEQSSKCLLPYETSPCYANDSSFKSSPFFYHLQRLFHSSPNKFAFSLF